MAEGRRLAPHRPRREAHCSAEALKWVGFGCLCLASFSTAVLQRGVLHLGELTGTALYDAIKPGGDKMGWASFAVLTSLLSTMAIPIYPKLLCEGWLHTRNQRKYLLRLLGLALLSEIPYDWAMTGKFVDFSVQNPVWGLALGLLMLCIFQQSEFWPGGRFLRVPVGLATLLWGMLLRIDLAPMTVALCAIYALCAKRRKLALGLATLVSMIQFPAPFGVFFVAWYDGRPAKTDGRIFYWLYPAQLLLFALLASLLA